MPFYTYIHTRNDTGAVFYIGKGHGGRAHSIGRNPHWNNIVAKHGHSVAIADHFDSEADAFAHERYLIASFRAMGHGLCNMTDGGEGTCGCFPSEETRAKLRGPKWSPEDKARMSAQRRGVKKSTIHKARISMGQMGRVQTPESKQKMSIAQKGHQRGNGGRVLTADSLARLSAAHLGKPLSPEHAAKARVTMLGKKHSLDSIKKMVDAATGRVMSDETKAKISAANKLWWSHREGK